MPFYILILTNTYSNVKSDTLKIMLSNLIILSDLLHHLVHHFHIKLHHFMIQYTTLPFFKILQNTSKYKGLRSYINLWKSIIRKSINSWSENRVFMATSNCCHINHGIIVSIKLTQNKEDLSNDNTRTIGETHHKRKNKETKSRYIYGNRFSDISFHPMDQYNRKI